MIRKYLTPLQVALGAGDFATAVVVFLAVSTVRLPWGAWEVAWQQMGLNAMGTIAGAAVLWVFWLWLLGCYKLRLRLSTQGEASLIFQAASLQAIFTFALLYLFDFGYVSRVFLLTYFASLVLVTIAERAVIRNAFYAWRSGRRSARYALVVGTGPAAQEWADVLENRRGLGITVIGHLSEEHERHGVTTRPLLGTIFDLEAILAGRVVDEVGIVLPPQSWGMVQAIASVAQEAGSIVRIPVPDGSFTLPGGQPDELDGLPVLSFVRGPQRFLALAIKQLIDYVGAAVGLVVLSPVLLAAAIYIRAKDGSPVLFRQTRVGMNGRHFTLVKFRTMYRDAEARLDEVRHLSKISGPALQLDDDPRVPAWGRFLRKTSIDELPQLWNVLKGDMSLIGPRPAPMVEVNGYDLWHRRRLSMKPGITGLAQVAARRFEDFDKRAELDLRYIDEWSPRLDLSVIARTVTVVFGGSGR